MSNVSLSVAPRGPASFRYTVWQELDSWLHHYNFHRTHASLNLNTDMERSDQGLRRAYVAQYSSGNSSYANRKSRKPRGMTAKPNCDNS